VLEDILGRARFDHRRYEIEDDREKPGAGAVVLYFKGEEGPLERQFFTDVGRALTRAGYIRPENWTVFDATSKTRQRLFFLGD
jgi:hypothetical protein